MFQKGRARTDMKVKFAKYRAVIKGKSYCILIPRNIDQFWINSYGQYNYGTYWDGNRNALNAIMYSSVVLGFDPNKIIYLPIRNNPVGEKYYYEKEDKSDTVPAWEMETG